MDAHRSVYKKCRNEVIQFTGDLYDSLATVDTMPLVDPKKSVARINNNRKFHPDKPPYKTHFGLLIDRGEQTAGFYVHIEPGASFVGAGLHNPQKEKLDAIRRQIDRDGDRLDQLRQSDTFQERFGSIDGAELKTSPRDYDQDHPYIHLLRKKSFTVQAPIKQSDFTQGKALKKITAIYRDALPFMRFFDQALQY